MTVVLARRADINLESFRRVVWRGEAVRLSEPALEERAGRCLDAALAMLAVMACLALHVTDRPTPSTLRGFVEELRAIVPPVAADRIPGPELKQLADSFTARVFAPA